VKKRLFSAILALSGASCGGTLDVRAPWEHATDHDIGRPVLGFLWKKIIHDRTTDNKPQESSSGGTSAKAAPTISSVTPSSAAANDSVVIAGTGFSAQEKVNSQAETTASINFCIHLEFKVRRSEKSGSRKEISSSSDFPASGLFRLFLKTNQA